MIRLLRNFLISLGIVSVMQLRMLSIIVVKLILDLFMLANLLKFLPAFTCAMEYVVLFITKLISYTNCTNAFIFLNGFPSPSFNREGVCRNAKFSDC